MNVTRISASDLKRNTAEVLNSVVYGGVIAVVERHGEPLVRIVPVEPRKKKKDFSKVVKKYFGAIPDFPEVHKMRYSRRKSLDW